MATIVLQAAGGILGSAFGPLGAVVGRAAGAMAGYAIDQAVINGTRRLEGPRLNDPRPFSAEDGAALPRVYGTVRVGGTLIWATRFEEDARAERQGGKGGPKVTTYSYFANLAFAVAEGPISSVRRIWADGRELDQTRLEIRLHRGGEDQMPDPLIEAKQGGGHAPTYRGTAYVVLERFPLEDYGNRVPQFQFEVIRGVSPVAEAVRAVTLIPGSTEYGLAPEPVTLQHRPGETEALNRHVLHAGSDLVAALDELQALCPKLEHIGLVATWFGDDLRAAHCRIRPMVTQGTEHGQSQPWRVSGMERADAAVVSRHEGHAAYGGSPSDRSLIDAIRLIKARGLKVTLYPFVMMDVAADNVLPDPWGGSAQAPYPWRGRITCFPATGQPGTVDGTEAVRAQIAAFVGSAGTGQFSREDGEIRFTGPGSDWGYRRFLLHFAHLAAEAGGVDAFLIGSELRGLTSVRDGAAAYPFVEALGALAGDCRAILGGGTSISYGADWSEYFGHQPAGTADMVFNLDPLWAHPAIDAIGIDNYMPLADWRDEDYGGGNPDGFSGPYDVDGMRGAIAGGEGFDWFYASASDRNNRIRSSITDGAGGKPWIYRYKDLVSWWSELHHNRTGGLDAAQPTGWVPRSKPIWFTELGCPAVDKGPNQPNVFPDPKSSESAVPYFSTGGRSDIAQARFLQAHGAHWNPHAPDFREADNPLSPIYGGRMVDFERIYLWAWDARPFPAFPQRADRWSDGNNWLLGHWLNGRLGGADGGDLVAAVLRDHGLEPADTSRIDGAVHGWLVEEPQSARQTLEPIVDLFGLRVRDDGQGLRFDGAAHAQAREFRELVHDDAEGVAETTRVADGELPSELILAFRDPFNTYQAASARAVQPGAASARQQALSVPAVLEPDLAHALAADRLRDHWAGREEISFAVAAGALDVVPGAVLRLPLHRPGEDFLVTGVEFGDRRRVRARRLRRIAPSSWVAKGPPHVAVAEAVVGPPHALLIDLPMLSGEAEPAVQFRIAAHARPWKSLAVLSSPEGSGFRQRSIVTRPASTGRLASALLPGVAGRLDHSQVLDVTLYAGALASQSTLRMLNGGGTLAVHGNNGAWEVLQFRDAEEIGPGLWRLGALLRGQGGTEDAAASGTDAGRDVVVLDEAVQPAGLAPAEVGLALNWRIGPTGYEVSDRFFTTQTVAGGMRALVPLAPVHLRGEAVHGGLAISWIRRGRLDADSWEAADIPLGEELERYEVRLGPPGGASLRTQRVEAPAFFYTQADMAADFGAMPAQVAATVRQIGTRAVGLPASIIITI